MNLFATVLTYAAPSANYGGEGELNRRPIQKITDGRFEYAILSPESLRNALREKLRELGLPMNRRRIEPTAREGERQQLAVGYGEFPDPERYADDFFLGYLLALGDQERERLRTARGEAFPLKRDSILRMNLAVALSPFRFDHVFIQSPQIREGWQVGAQEGGYGSALLQREVVHSAFQYPFAMNLTDCRCLAEGCDHGVGDEGGTGQTNSCKQRWTRSLLLAIGQLSGVAGNQTRSLYDMAPASIVVRLTEQLVFGYNSYGFVVTRDERTRTDSHRFPEVVDGILYGEPKRKDGIAEKDEHGRLKWEREPDYEPSEFYLGGLIVKQLEAEHETAVAERGKKGDQPRTRLERLKELGVTFDRDPRRLLMKVADRAFTDQAAVS